MHSLCWLCILLFNSLNIILHPTHRKGSDVDEITIDPSANWTPVDKPKDSGKDDEADSPPAQKKVKLDTSAPGTPSTAGGGGGTPRGAAGGSGSSGAGAAGSTSGTVTGDGSVQKTGPASNCNSIPPLSQVRVKCGTCICTCTCTCLRESVGEWKFQRLKGVLSWDRECLNLLFLPTLIQNCMYMLHVYRIFFYHEHRLQPRSKASISHPHHLSHQLATATPLQMPRQQHTTITIKNRTPKWETLTAAAVVIVAISETLW